MAVATELGKWRRGDDNGESKSGGGELEVNRNRAKTAQCMIVAGVTRTARAAGLGAATGLAAAESGCRNRPGRRRSEAARR